MSYVILRVATLDAGDHAPGAGQLGRDDGGRRRRLAQGQSGLPNLMFFTPHKVRQGRSFAMQS